jgi:hypothetical protein
MNKKRFKQVCETCGSENVKADAWAAWDKESQRWELENVFENSYCGDCQGECHVEEVEIKQ